jgi:hypothetical protein
MMTTNDRVIAKNNRDVCRADRQTFIDNNVNPGHELIVIEVLIKVQYGNKTMIVNKQSLQKNKSYTNNNSTDKTVDFFSDMFGFHK